MPPLMRRSEKETPRWMFMLGIGGMAVLWIGVILYGFGSFTRVGSGKSDGALPALGNAVDGVVHNIADGFSGHNHAEDHALPNLSLHVEGDEPHHAYDDHQLDVVAAGDEEEVAQEDGVWRKETSPAFEALRYWNNPRHHKWRREESLFPAPAKDKFLTFEIDYGGFSNIRKQFEYICIAALLLGRTLVIPPPRPWYLIDFGPKTRKGKDLQNTVSDFVDFFDMEDLATMLPTISTFDYMHLTGSNVACRSSHLSQEFLLASRKAWKKNDNNIRETWFKWLRDNCPMADWDPLNKVLFYKTMADVKSLGKLPVPPQHMANRPPFEISQEEWQARTLHFPMWWDPPNKKQYRFFGNNAGMAVYADPRMRTEHNRFLRDSVHYKDLIFEYAARVVDFLGVHNYTSMHIRRNDFQYKENFQEAEVSLERSRVLFKPGETIYLSSDEMKEGFFQPFVDAGYHVYRWEDMFTDKGGNVMTGIEVDDKYVGLVEQVVCSGARRFIGTRSSTFSAYISRIRGYINVPGPNYDNKLYFHLDQTQPGLRLPVDGRDWGSEAVNQWENMRRRKSVRKAARKMLK